MHAVRRGKEERYRVGVPENASCRVMAFKSTDSLATCLLIDEPPSPVEQLGIIV